MSLVRRRWQGKLLVKFIWLSAMLNLSGRRMYLADTQRCASLSRTCARLVSASGVAKTHPVSQSPLSPRRRQRRRRPHTYQCIHKYRHTPKQNQLSSPQWPFPSLCCSRGHWPKRVTSIICVSVTMETVRHSPGSGPDRHQFQCSIFNWSESWL